MRRIWPTLLFGVSVLLAGCASSENPPSEVISASCEQLHAQQKLANQLRSDGIQVVQVGDETTLVMSADYFFASNSNNVNFDSGTMKDIINFINAYPTVNVQVMSYPRKVGSTVRSLALSRARAEAVATYLSKHGLETRLISADTKRDFCDEPRIEIFFRLPPPTNVFH